MEQERTVYKSQWDWFTWLILVIVVAGCSVPAFFGEQLLAAIIALIMLAFVLAMFIGTYYVIDGDTLIVYSCFISAKYPIEKIAQIKPTKSVLSAPATSLTHRIAITFTDKKVMKSSMPLVISPVRREEFLSRLLAINPSIKL